MKGKTSRRLPNRLRDDRGQASIELIGVLPWAFLAALVAWQLVVAGHTLWLCSQAARVAARAHAVGRDSEAAARSALPRSLERGLRVEREGRRLHVRIRVPLLLRGWRSPVSVGASSSLGGPR